MAIAQLDSEPKQPTLPDVLPPDPGEEFWQKYKQLQEKLDLEQRERTPTHEVDPPGLGNDIGMFEDDNERPITILAQLKEQNIMSDAFPATPLQAPSEKRTSEAPRGSETPFKLNEAPGLLTPGTITDLDTRPLVELSEGERGTIKAFSFEEDGKEVLIPSIVSGKVLNEKAAIAHYGRTGEHLGIFDTPESATAYSKALSERQGQRKQDPALNKLLFSPNPMDPNIAIEVPPEEAKAIRSFEVDQFDRAISKLFGTSVSGKMSTQGTEERYQLWPERAVRAVIDAISLPGETFRGEVDPYSPETFERTMNLAPFAVLGMAPLRAALIARKAAPQIIKDKTLTNYDATISSFIKKPDDSLEGAVEALLTEFKDINLTRAEALEVIAQKAKTKEIDDFYRTLQEKEFQKAEEAVLKQYLSENPNLAKPASLEQQPFKADVVDLGEFVNDPLKPKTFTPYYPKEDEGFTTSLVEEMAILKAYAGAAYHKLNSTLWEKATPSPAIKKQIELMDSLFEKSKLLREATVYRGIGEGKFSSIKGKMKPGEIVEFPGYTSTSFDPFVAKGFGQHVFEIKVPKGAKGIDVEKTGVYFSGEKEIVLPRNTKFKVERIEPEGMIFLQVVP